MACDTWTCASTLGGLLVDDQFSRLLAVTEESFQPFTPPDGSISFGMPALCVVADAPTAD